MKHKTSATVLLILVAVAVAGADAGDSRVLRGEYALDGAEDSGQIEAVFQAAGEGAWNVDFHFTFQGQAHTFSGTARGGLSEGSLEGRVQDEGLRRTFTLWGEFTAGRFQGRHAEIEDGFEELTGTLVLAAAGD